MSPAQKANEIAELRDKKWTWAEYEMFRRVLELYTREEYAEAFNDGFNDGVTHSELKNADAKTFP